MFDACKDATAELQYGVSTPCLGAMIDIRMATAIAEGLAEDGLTDALDVFVAAVTWPQVRSPDPNLPIAVSPEVTAAMLAVVNGGQQNVFFLSGFSSQQVFVQATQWQAELTELGAGGVPRPGPEGSLNSAV